MLSVFLFRLNRAWSWPDMFHHAASSESGFLDRLDLSSDSMYILRNLASGSPKVSKGPLGRLQLLVGQEFVDRLYFYIAWGPYRL